MPDLPGCFSAADEGIDQAIENAKEAIARWIDDTTERVNITLPRRILALLDHKAKSAGETRSGYIAQMTLTH